MPRLNRSGTQEVLKKQHLQFHVSLVIQYSRYRHLHSHIRKLRLALPNPAESQMPSDALSTYLMTVGLKGEKRHPQGPRKLLGTNSTVTNFKGYKGNLHYKPDLTTKLTFAFGK